jgi:hypothetical protein
LFVTFVFFWSLATMGLVLQSHIYEGGVLVAGVFLACHAIFIVVGVWKFVWWVDGSFGDVSCTLFWRAQKSCLPWKAKRIVSLSMEEGREQTISGYPPETIHHQILIVKCFVSSQLQESCHYQN